MAGLMISFGCPGCGAAYRVKLEFAGRKTRCAQCRHALVVPEISIRESAVVPGLPQREPKRFDLNIDKILENWEICHAIRELIANAIDESVLTKTPAPT